ncbi:MAG: glycolate oxidase subunit GlcE [Brucellaceae bacterium]|nr:glycolate oxidase subunit GlcE [Brucellaceae bacterium]
MTDRLTPATEAEAAAIIAEAFAASEPLAICGGNSRAGLGRPVQAARTLSAAALSGITEYNPGEMVLTAKAGTPLAEIEEALAQNRQRLVFEPMDHRALFGSSGEPTIGAVAAANISGPRRFVAGAARDSLLGVRFVNGRGEVIRNGGKVMKNVTGLDLVKLMAGSFGTLGFLTEVTFKVQPVPETEVTLALRGLLDDAAAQAMAHAMATSFEVSGAAHLPELVAKGVAGGALGSGAATLFRIEGFADSVAIRASRLKALLAPLGAIDELDAAQSAAVWQDVRDVKPFADGTQKPVWRISMKPADAHEAVMALRMQAGASAFYDWQGGLVWLRMEAGEAEDGLVRAAVKAHGGGHATLARADESTRAAVPVFQPDPAPVAELARRVKMKFDPKGILNPGRMAAGL